MQPVPALAVSFLAVLLLASVPAPAYGQAAAMNGQVEGTITDPAGAAVPEAEVALRNLDTGLTRSQKADVSGFYRFPLLPLGNYELAVSASGFAAARRSGIVLNAGANAVIDVALALGATATEVLVTAAPPAAEPGRVDIGSTLSGGQVSNLPLISRNTFNFILLQPNVSGRPNPELGVPRKVNANGFSGRINYQMDGSNNTQGDRAGIRLMPVSNTFIGEVQQVSNGFAPEFGNTVGTVFNSLTKSGANNLYGEAAYLFRRTAFNTHPPLLAAHRPKPDLTVNNFFGNAGGRVIRDKLFFFGGYESLARAMPTVITAVPAAVSAIGLPARSLDAAPFSQDAQFAMGRGDWHVNSRNTVFFRYNSFRNDSPYNSVAAQGLADTSHWFRDRVHAVAAQWISTLSPNVLNEFRFQVPQRLQWREAGDWTGAGPIVNIAGQVTFNGSADVGFRAVERTPEIVNNLSVMRGRHHFRMGGTFRWIQNENRQAVFAQYNFPNVQAYLDARSGVNPRGYANFVQRLGDPNLEFGHQFNSLFWQDTWKVRPNITLTYGLRHDLYRLPAPAHDAPLEISRSFRLDRNNWAPRVGLAWGLGREQKTVIRASGGIFYDPPQTDVYRRAIINSGNPRIFNVAAVPAQAFAPNYPNIFTGVPAGFSLPIQNIETVSPDFRTLYSVNANLQITREIFRNTSLSAGYMFTKGTALPVYRNTNLQPGPNRLADGRPIFLAARLDPRFNNVIMAESVGNSSFNGLNLTLNRRFSKTLDLFASYTWSHAIDDAPEQNNIDSGTTVFPSDPTNRSRDRGRSLSDRRHVLNLSGVVRPSWSGGHRALRAVANNNQLAFILTAMSGDVFNVGGNRNLNNDPTIPNSLQRPLFIGRNTYRGPATRQFDLRYSRFLPARERWRPEFFAEFTNLFNTVNVTGVNTIAAVDAQGTILAAPPFAYTAALDQRLLQFGFRLNF
jgi:hypothetical protein